MVRSCWQGWFLPRLWGRICSRLFLGGCWPSLSCLGLQNHHPDLCLHLHMGFFLCVHFQISPFYKDTRHTEVGTYSAPVWPGLNLMASAMAPFPNKATFWDNGTEDFNIWMGGEWVRDTVTPIKQQPFHFPPFHPNSPMKGSHFALHHRAGVST